MSSSSTGRRRYYCHVCQASTNPIFQDSSVKCGICDQGFVEEVGGSESETLGIDSDDVINAPIISIMSALQSAVDNVTFTIPDDFRILTNLQDEPVSANTRSRARRRPDVSIGGLEFIMQMLLNSEINPFGLGSTPPASPADIALLPKKTITEDDLKTVDVCSICLEKFKLMDEMLTMPCSHGFHQSCLTTWLRQKGSCPICRKDLHGRETS